MSPDGAMTGVVHIRVTAREMELLPKLAERHGFKNISAFVRCLVFSFSRKAQSKLLADAVQENSNGDT